MTPAIQISMVPLQLWKRKVPRSLGEVSGEEQAAVHGGYIRWGC